MRRKQFFIQEVLQFFYCRKKIFFAILFSFIYSEIFSQVYISGKIFRASDSSALEQVIILQLKSSTGSLSSFDGSFHITAELNSIILFRRSNFITDSFFVKQNAGTIYLEIFLKDNPIVLPEFKFVQRKSIKIDPYEKRKEWSYVLDRPRATAQSPLTALYEKFSRKGKELQKLEALYYEDERKRMVNERFTRIRCYALTGLQGRDLDAYMNFCRPTYEYVLIVTDYQLVYNMQQCFEEFLLRHHDIQKRLVEKYKNDSLEIGK